MPVGGISPPGVSIGPADHAHLAPLTAAIFGLTPRELQVAELVAGGHATRRTAHMLGISPYTTQEHLRHIFGKVGVGSRGELVAALFLEGAKLSVVDSTLLDITERLSKVECRTLN